MAIPSSVIQDITEKTDIVDLVSRYVNLKRSGADFLGLCPFHSEKNIFTSLFISKIRQTLKTSAVFKVLMILQ